MSEVTRVPILPIAKGSLTKLWVGIAIAVLIAGTMAWAGISTLPQSPATFLADNAGEDGVETTDSGLQFKELVAGSGASPGPRDLALVNYEGRFQDGTVFDEGERIPMEIAAVVPGFSEALQKMQRGGQYRIWIKPELGYGMEDRVDPQTGEVGIPGGSLLEFDIDLLEFATFEQVQQMQQQMQQQQGAQQGPPGGPPLPIQ